MTWTNAFDVGECNVIVTAQNDDDFSALFEGVLAKGDGVDFNELSGDHLPLRVDVLDDGSVVLSCSDEYNITSYSFDSIALRVVPTDSIADKSIRISGITLSDGVQTGIPVWADFDGWVNGTTPGVELTRDGTSASPDPADLSDQPIKSEFGLDVWRGDL